MNLNKTTLGIEFGSMRIKMVLIDESRQVLAEGSYGWENELKNGFWTYDEEEFWRGLQKSYQKLSQSVQEKYGMAISRIGAIGISAMMHGYLAIGKDGLLVPFRTWRNNTTTQAANELTELFRFNIPERWSIAHLYQAILNAEGHVKDIVYLTTLAGYIHWKLTGRKVIGTGDASGMFPVDSCTGQYDRQMVDSFDMATARYNYPWKLLDLLPRIVPAKCEAGRLTEEGALLLDPTGVLCAGIPFAAPEGDAQTGMIATNSIVPGTGNISIGTSTFATIVLKNKIEHLYPQLDIMATPEGFAAVNVHVSNGTSDINAWIGLFEELLSSFGISCEKDVLFERLFQKALEGATDCDRVLTYGFYSGEAIMEVPEGRPMLIRYPDSKFNLANLMRANIYSTMAALRTGVDLLREEQVEIQSITAQGGLFRTKGVGQRFLAAAFNAPVAVMENAGEGGAWGMALLAQYMLLCTTASNNEDPYTQDLAAFTQYIFKDAKAQIVDPIKEDTEGFEKYLKQYRSGIETANAAANNLTQLT